MAKEYKIANVFWDILIGVRKCPWAMYLLTVNSLSRFSVFIFGSKADQPKQGLWNMKNNYRTNQSLKKIWIQY